jgi:hypothetical protein
MIQSDTGHGLTSKLNLLGQELLVPEHLLHDLVPQIHLCFQLSLIGTQRIHPSEQKVEILVHLVPTRILLMKPRVPAHVVLTKTFLHPIQQQLSLH